MNHIFKYARLKEIVKDVKPLNLKKMIDGTPPMYPVSVRHQTYKYFTIDHDVDGQEMYRIGYYRDHEKIEVSKAEFEEKYRHKYTEKQIKNWWYENDDSWSIYLYKPRTHLILRADDTIEFAESYYAQGERQFINGGGWSRRGYLASSVKHGGMVYFTRLNDKNHIIPIFKGFRFNPDTNEVHDSSKYIVTQRRINRKSAKEIVNKYQDKFNLAKAMFSAMPNEIFQEQIESVIAEYVSDAKQNVHYGTHYLSESVRNKTIEIADKLLDDKPIDAFFLYMKSMGLHRYYHPNNLTDAMDSYYRTIKAVTKRIYYIHGTFDYTTYDHKHSLGSSSWVIDVKVNNKQVIR